MSAVKEAMTKLESHRERIVAGDSKVAPGEPIHITDAFAPGDGVAQGDLYFEILAEVPPAFKLQESPGQQLVPGNTTGSRHWLEDPSTCDVFYPAGFKMDNLEATEGPVLRVNREARVIHPTHGPVTIPAGLIVGLYYQTEWEKEERRRVQD